MIIDELIALLGFETKGQDELRKFNQGLETAEKKAEAAARRINALSVAIGTFVGQMAVDLARSIGRTIGSLPGDIIGVGSVFEKLETTLTTIEGSSDKAKAALDWVADFAATTPYELNEVAEAFVRMRAYGLDPMSGQLEGIGNAASAMGKGLMQGVEAIADAVTGENERLKEFGIRASAEKDKITYTWQQAGETMTKTVKKDGTEIANALMEIFSRFDGAMEAQSKTWEGMTSNLGNQWTVFLKSIADAGYYEDVKRRFRDMVGVIDVWRERGYLDRAAQGISKFLTGSMQFAERIGKIFWDIGRAAYYSAAGITDLISRITGLNTAASVGVLGAAVLGSTGTGRALLLALAKKMPALGAFLLVEDLMSGLRGDDSYIGSLEGGQEALDKIKVSSSELAAAIKDLTSAFDGLLDFDFAGFSWGKFINDEIVRFVRELSAEIENLKAGILWLRENVVDPVGAGIDRLFGDDRPGEVAHPSSGGIYGTRDNVDPRRPVHGGIIRDAPREKTDYADGVLDYILQLQNEEGLRNLRGNLAKMSPDAAASAVLNDNSVANDNRDQSVNVGSPNVTVNVQQAVEAPAAAGAAVGNAVGAAAGGQLGRRVTGN